MVVVVWLLVMLAVLVVYLGARAGIAWMAREVEAHPELLDDPEVRWLMRFGTRRRPR